MDFISCIQTENAILMEGALGERLKREYQLVPDEQVALAGLLYSEKGRDALKAIWSEYRAIAQRYGLPFLATTPTRRANQERAAGTSFGASIITDHVQFLRGIQQADRMVEMYVGGLMGCKGDAYTGKGALPTDEARRFHRWQAERFCDAGVDFLYAGIMPALSEAMGMAQAMADTGLPYIISFTIQRDGKLIDGTSISEAIARIDRLSGNRQPICYMTNCVHPRIVYEALTQPYNRNELVYNRFRGIQANTSPLSYAELDGSADLKCSEPNVFADEMLELRDISRIHIFGGCCGTDNRHMEEVARRLHKELKNP